MVIFSVVGFCRWDKGFYCFSGKLDFGRLFLREMGVRVDSAGFLVKSGWSGGVAEVWVVWVVSG